LTLCQLSSDIGCQNDHDIHKALIQDGEDIVGLLQSILNSDVDKNAVLQLQGADAESFLTLTYSVHVGLLRLSLLTTSDPKQTNISLQ
jgi:hypothetical protein